jgi:hypothetical protein
MGTQTTLEMEPKIRVADVGIGIDRVDTEGNTVSV